MKIKKISVPQVIMSNPESIHNYFAWPTVVRLKNGRIATGASGFRLAHICPFGKSTLSFSDDEGETYTLPMPVIDTVLDDRDTGLCPFGESGLIVTSFNNTVEFQRSKALTDEKYRDAYLNLVPPERERAALGSTFRVSFDNGVTFGPIFHSPTTSPHGPMELKNGSVLWIGRTHSKDDSDQGEADFVGAYQVNPETGDVSFVGRIPSIEDEYGHILSCEPHTVELPDGTLLCHIRVNRYTDRENARVFTVYQSRSRDGGKTWEKPYAILPRLGGSPPHLLMLSSGTLICTYGYREKPAPSA